MTKAETANSITRNVIRVVNMTPGAVAYRINNAAVYDEKAKAYRKGNIEKGLPDVIAIYKGRFIGIEVKANKDRMSVWQLHRREEIVQADGLFFVATSTDSFLEFWTGVKSGKEL